jgi:hypothetical protein
MAEDEEVVEGADLRESALRPAARVRTDGGVVALLAGTEIVWLVAIGYVVWRLLT